MKSKVDSSEKVLTSKLNFVALKEATYINKSLTFLEQVVVALTDKTKRKEYVPYKQSKLIHILKDSEKNFILETLSTLILQRE